MAVFCHLYISITIGWAGMSDSGNSQYSDGQISLVKPTILTKAKTAVWKRTKRRRKPVLNTSA